jgi:hypothetical protein
MAICASQVFVFRPSRSLKIPLDASGYIAIGMINKRGSAYSLRAHPSLGTPPVKSFLYRIQLSSQRSVYINSQPFLDHALDQSVDLVFPVARLSVLHKVDGLLALEPARRVAQLERPEEVGSLLEGRADGDDFVDQVLDALNAVFAERLLNDLVGGNRDTLAVDLGETTLVNEFANGLQVGVAGGRSTLARARKVGTCHRKPTPKQ